jgi:glycosyltransferase involved in cell wall biosynthesis
MISVLILTKNEEKDLSSCLASVSWCDDIHVFDSFSSDTTVEIAISAGARVTQRKFDGYASQRNAALDNLPFKHDWILILDADERIPLSLMVEMLPAVQGATAAVSGYRIRRKDYLFDSWLKHAQISPYYIRLVRRGRASYVREVNEVLEVNGEIAELREAFDHFPFSKGFSHWIEKHNRYSSMEAQRWIDEQKGSYDFSLKKALFNEDFSVRRYHQKGLFYKLPCRPLIKWLYMVLWRRSFLDGSAGITYATLQAIYEYFIVLKTRELLSKDNS